MAGFQPPVFTEPDVVARLIPEMWGDIDEFVGPQSALVLGNRYFSLTSHGRVDEGCALPGPPAWSPAEAWYYYAALLKSELVDAIQVAWRCFPALQQNPSTGAYVVRSRLFIFKGGVEYDT